MNLHGKNLIGRDISSQSGETFTAYDPAAGKNLEPPFHEGTASEVDAALRLAANAFEIYRQLDADRRAIFLEHAADALMALGADLIDRASAETGLPTARIESERGRTVNQLRMFAEVIREGSWIDARIDTAIPDRKPVPKPDLRRMLIPLGPVVVFGASNFPLAYSVAGGDTASALAAGCPVIVKAHPAHPGTSELVGRAILQAADETDMPDGVFSMIHGRSTDVGMALVKHPLTTAVGFTGSLRGGRALFDAAAARPVPIPVYAEMGSTNPVFILPGAMKEHGSAIVAGLYQSVTLGAGQFCTKPGLIIASDPPRNFVDELASRIGNTAPITMLHPGIRDAYEKGVQRLQSIGGVHAIGHPKQAADSSKTEGSAFFFTTDAQTLLHEHIVGEEVFGPATVLVQTKSTSELEQIARSLDGHLTATIHASDHDLAEYSTLIAILETKVGRLIFNGYPTGVEVCPSMNHGGPYPATTDVRTTSVGTAAIGRFARPICYQNVPQNILPIELRNENARQIWRLVNNQLTKNSVNI
jgi:alpha-ketoglutaric semialdehyde dehydrogenase